MAIVWPAFLTACILQMLVFAVIDPHDLHWSGTPLAVSRQGIYTGAFFAFWAICIVSSALTALLAMPAQEVNKDEGARAAD